MTQYRAIVDRVIPALSSLSAEHDSVTSEWSPDLAEAKLFARLNEDDRGSVDNPVSRRIGPESEPVGKPPSSEEALWSHMWVQFAAAVMLVAALGLMAYRIGKRRGTDTAARTFALSKPATNTVQVAEAPGSKPGLSTTNDAEPRLEALQSQLREKIAEVEHLKTQQAEIENQISVAQADRNKLVRDRAALAEQLEIAQQNLESTQQKLDLAVSRGSQEIARNAALQQKIGELTQSVSDRDQEVARERELLDHDRDIRELMGSRDLYIAEVYDVAKTGDIEKPFGRVFYTKGKSLIFYAYDLDQKPGIEPASTFQAWGRIGPDRDRAINLGIFYQDNANRKRWVLKSENPKTLAQIDAVFVTVEPSGGSAHPSGKPLLFAYLKIKPNHP